MRQGFRGLARPRSPSEIVRGEGKARENFEDGPAGPAPIADHRRDGRDPEKKPVGQGTGPLAAEVARAQTDDQGRHRAGQQDGTDHVGAADEGGRLSARDGNPDCRHPGRWSVRMYPKTHGQESAIPCGRGSPLSERRDKPAGVSRPWKRISPLRSARQAGPAPERFREYPGTVPAFRQS